MLCALTFAFGLWSTASPTTLYFAIQSTGSATIKALFPADVLTVRLGIGLSALATFMFFVAVMGFWGAITRSQFLLFMKGLQEQDGQWTHAVRLVFGCCDHNT
ncbi:unnamed protein product [Diatraea saccharalis]|uniref:Uncharacterized protein n=1 Tax=Diatraea saccharalis TaxID=40085 RepID=A0A9N9R596_9NEOP|nr:unnamed protein product [Diatraea saccharalis]